MMSLTTKTRRIRTGLTGLTGWGEQKGDRRYLPPDGAADPGNPVNPVKFRFGFGFFVSSWFIPAALCLSLAGCRLPARSGAATTARSDVQFVDVSEQAGIHFTHTSGASGRLYLPETMGAGCAFLDYDGDGRQDLFFVNSSRLPGFRGKGPFYSALYRNRGDGTFQDVTRPAGLAFECYGMGCAVGDYDNDGREDLYVTALGGNHLFHNERGPTGEARFVDVTRRAGAAASGFSTSCAWLDYNRDGYLDLFVCRYARWSPEINRICLSSAGPYLCTPTAYQGQPSLLYRNNGNGTFTDVTAAAGLASPVGKSLGVAVCDYDHDGWPDLAIANDTEPNQLYRNNHDGTFTDRGVAAGIAYSSAGQTRAGMGIDTADPVNDGHEAVLIGNFASEGLAFYRDDGHGGFSDQALEVGLSRPSSPFLMFGVLFRDYDLDGFPDILTANGHIDAHVEKRWKGLTFTQRLTLYHNLGPDSAGLPHFEEIGERAGAALATRRVWRGLAWADFDNDGDPDFLVTACNGRPMLLRNDGGNRNHWLKVQLEGVKSNREGLGSQVTVEVGKQRQTGWVRSGSSYGSSSELKALFGLGKATKVDRVVVRWASGAEEAVRDVAADRLIVIREGRSGVRSPPLMEIKKESGIRKPGR
jgi:enediyne biosynthesis protein E4